MSPSIQCLGWVRSRLLLPLPAILLLVLAGAHAPLVAAASIVPSNAISVDGASFSCGTGWQIVSSPPLSTGGQLWGVATIPGTKQLWAVGDQTSSGSSTPLIERWNGSAWSVVASPTVTGGAVKLQAVTALSSSNAWAVGTVYANPTALTVILHWNGSQWSHVPSPNVGATYNILYGVAAIAANAVWAVGYQSSDASNAMRQQLIEQWNGRVWSVVPSPTTPGSNSDLYAVTRVAGSAQVLAVGDTYSGTTPPDSTLIERWTGSQWQVMSSPSVGSFGSVLLGVSARASDDAWAVGYYYGPSNGQNGHTQQTLVEHFNGQSWKVVASPNLTNGGILLDNVLNGVAQLSGSSAFAVGTYDNPSGDFNYTLGQRWNGARWSLVTTPTQGAFSELTGVAAIPSVHQVWAVGYGDPTDTGAPLEPLIEARC